MITGSLPEALPSRWAHFVGMPVGAIKDTLEAAYNIQIEVPPLGEHPLRTPQAMAIVMTGTNPNPVNEEHLRTALYSLATAEELLRERGFVPAPLKVSMMHELFADDGPQSGAMISVGPDESVVGINLLGWQVQRELLIDPTERPYNEAEAQTLVELLVRCLALTVIVPKHYERVSTWTREARLQSLNVLREHKADLSEAAFESSVDTMAEVFMRLMKRLPVPEPVLEIYREQCGVEITP